MVRTRAKKGTSRQTSTDDNAEGQSSEEWQLWLLDFEKESEYLLCWLLTELMKVLNISFNASYEISSERPCP